jgi:hypothetical protein
MGHAASKNWPKGTTITGPYTWRPDDFRRSIRTEEHERIGMTLRKTYAELLQQPLSPRLELLVHEIKARWEAPSLHG